jgi:multidrug resistance efflux pump
VTDQAVTDADVAEAAAPEPAAPSGRRSLKRETKIRLLVIGVVALLVTAAFLTYYLIESRTYVTTDNAQVDGNQISITAPTSGILIDWHGQQGTQLQQNAPVGRIEIQGGFMQPQMVIRTPADGVVAVDNGVPGSFVTAGTQLAIAYDGSGVFITARVDETEIDEVHVGAPVKISVDAFPNAGLTGRVSEIKTGAAGVFSLFPQSNTSGNFQKVTQVIPVKITIDDLQNLPLVPGMNATVKIHRG